MRLIAEGGIGRVYAARDEVLGRRVALKFLRAAKAGGRELLEEARATARLAHPNVVTVLGVGRHEGAVYIALEYLDGETLESRLLQGPLAAGEALRITLGVARALEHAHASGLLHLDLKPNNVLVAADGRPRVVDFGLAESIGSKRVGDERLVARGFTPGFAAPEQALGLPVSPATDVWGLCRLFVEMLLGRFAAETRGEMVAGLGRTGIDKGLADLVERGLSGLPDERPPLALLTRALEASLELRRARGGASRTPFRGASPLGEEDAGLFFGRASEVSAIAERLRQGARLTVVGPSGVGKTSLVAAGVVPRLREMGPLAVVWTRPGADPVRSLTTALEAAFAALGATESIDLAGAPGRLQGWMMGLARRVEGTALLVVDQLEEIVTLASTDARQRFLDLLERCGDDPDDPVRLVACLRDDFVGQAAPRGPLVPLRPMTGALLEEVATEAVAARGYRFESEATVAALRRELEGEASALPLLQFTLAALWARRDEASRTLPHRAYEALGGVEGALFGAAERALEGLDAPTRAATQKLLLALVNPNGTRRPRSRAEVEGLVGDGAVEVLERLVQARVVSTAEGQVELVHEALALRWPPLVRWLDDAHEERRLLRDLEDAARLWDRRGRRADDLWSPADVALARARLQGEMSLASSRSGGKAAPPLATAFLAASEARARRTARVRLGAWVAAVGLTTGLAVISVFVALEFRARAQAAERQSRRLDLAGADIGRFDLVLRPVDWDPEARAVRPLAEPARHLGAVRLHEPSPPGVALGMPVPPPRASIGPSPEGGSDGWARRIEARSGPATLVIERQGPEGRRCTPSVLGVRSLPGYAEREAGIVHDLVVPSCRASQAGMVEVPAGPFFVGHRPGVRVRPPTMGELREVELPTFWIDRTEVTNAQLEVYLRARALTGAVPPRYPDAGFLKDSGAPDRPATSVDAATAEAVCRFWGKRLPTQEEWIKAARGGRWLDAARSRPNPYPERLAPWGPGQRTINLGGAQQGLMGIEDGWAGPAPVDAFPGAASPYGILGLGGNVAEWTATPASKLEGLRVVMGGAWDIPAELQFQLAVRANAREPRYFAFDLGFRCVADVVKEDVDDG